MPMTLTQAIARTRFLLDDTDSNPLVTDAEITTALVIAQEEVWQMVVSSGVNIFYRQASVTSSGSGVINVSSLRPIKIANIATNTGPLRIQIPPARLYDGQANVLQALPLTVTYVPHVTAPVLGTDEFIWSQATISMTTLDQLCCHIAASQCWVRTGDPPNAAMEKRKQELIDSIHTIVQTPSWSATPLGERGGRESGMAWVRTAHDVLQLVYGG
jgi:hypothetical protein